MKDQGWVPAKFLQPGDLLQSEDQQYLPVEGVADSGEVETVYNFRISDYHTYFVGDPTWGFGVWAHNYGKQVRANDGRSLSKMAAKYRVTNNIFSKDTNIAVIRYITKNGTIKHVYGRAVRYGYHAEKDAFNKLPRYVQEKPNKYIKGIYTEFKPCKGCENSFSGKGSSRIMMNLPQSKVRYSFTGPQDPGFGTYISKLFPKL
ncbi:MAG: polymorphic toxin-type HINT domain-containing protein [Zavarzinella sp.]